MTDIEGATERLREILTNGEDKCLCVTPGGSAFTDLRVVLDALDEAREVLAGADHTSAKYWRRMADAEREMHARELHHFEEEQKSAELAAVIERIDGEVKNFEQSDNDALSAIEHILSKVAPVDALRERDAEKWDEGYVRGWGEGHYTELSEHEYRHPKNPYRKEQS